MSDEEITGEDEWIEVEVPMDVLMPLLRKAFALKGEGKRSVKLVVVLDGRVALEEGDKLRRIDIEEWKK